MIDIREVLVIHEILIEEFDGTKGIRDRNLLESSITRQIAALFRACHSNALHLS